MMTIQENWENWLSQSGSFLDVQNYKSSDFKNIDLTKTWPKKSPDERRSFDRVKKYTYDFLFSDITLENYRLTAPSQFRNSIQELTSSDVDSNIGYEIGASATRIHHIKGNYVQDKLTPRDSNSLKVCYIFSGAFDTINQDEIDKISSTVLDSFDLVVSLDQRMNSIIKRHGENGKLDTSVIFSWMGVENNKLSGYYRHLDKILIDELLNRANFGSLNKTEVAYELGYKDEADYEKEALNKNILSFVSSDIESTYSELQSEIQRRRDLIRTRSQTIDANKRNFRTCGTRVNHAEKKYECTVLRHIFHMGLMELVDDPDANIELPWKFRNPSTNKINYSSQQKYGIFPQELNVKNYTNEIKDAQTAFEIYNKFDKFVNEDTDFTRNCECTECDNFEIWKWKHFHHYDTFESATSFTFGVTEDFDSVPLFNTKSLGNCLKETLLEPWIANRQTEIRAKFLLESEERNRNRRRDY